MNKNPRHNNLKVTDTRVLHEPSLGPARRIASRAEQLVIKMSKARG